LFIIDDIDDTTSPLEAGLAWITKFTKDLTAGHFKAERRRPGTKTGRF